jgi:hypothetical protein
MMIKALIVEQLEADGLLRTMRMQPSTDRDIVVAFAGDYNERRYGPFHFLDEEDDRRFREGFARCRARRIANPKFIRNGSSFHVETNWYGIPTQRNWLSYYALSLPKFGIPEQISISDPHKAGRQYRRFVTRDKEHHRWIIYLECASTHGRFDFDLCCDYRIDELSFANIEYRDPKISEHGGRVDEWKRWLSQPQQEKVNQFFIGSISMGDNYSAGQAGAMGPGAQATGNTFQQSCQHSDGSIDLLVLAKELELLRQQLRKEATESRQDVSIGEVALAQTAASEGNGTKALQHLRNAGKWAFNVSTKIGVGVATAALKTALGL